MITYFEGVRLSPEPLEFIRVPGIPYVLKSSFVDLYNEYAYWWADSRFFPFHDFLSEIILNRLGPKNCKYYRGYDSKISVDIVYHNRFIEVETGLKHSFSRLNMRLKRYRNYFYVVVPNTSVKVRYRRGLRAFHGRLLTIKEFVNLTEY